MSYTTQIVQTLGSALLVACTAVALGRRLVRQIAALDGARRQVWGGVMLLPYLTPSLLTGYVFARGAWTGALQPAQLHSLYLLLLILKLTPIAALASSLLPSGLSSEAAYSAQLVGPRGIVRRVAFRAAAAGIAPFLALGVVFLLAFSEFELAALWTTQTWTVALFDAHAGGLALSQSLRLAAAPTAISAFVLLALLGGASKIGSAGFQPLPARDEPSRVWSGYLVTAAALTCFGPLAVVLFQAARGWRSLMQTFALDGDLLASVFFATVASGVAYFVAKALRHRSWIGMLLSLPGLCAALVVSLLLLAFFQVPPLRRVYDTPVPLLIGLTILLLPTAFVAQRLIAAAETNESVFAARLAGNGGLLWRLRDRARFAVWGLLFCIAYFEFTASSILAPVGFTPVFVRLHNLMHYGQTAVLSAMLAAALFVPLAVLLLTGAGARLYAEHNGR